MGNYYYIKLSKTKIFECLDSVSFFKHPDCTHLVGWSLDNKEKPIQVPGRTNSMVKSQYAYQASSLSSNEPTQLAGQKILYNQTM